MDDLPERTVRILRIKNEYCNGIVGGYTSENNEMVEDTNYEIIYNGETISDTLVIPYQVDGKYVDGGIDGEYYKVVEVNLLSYGNSNFKGFNGGCYSFPKVETVICPNTVEKLFCYTPYTHSVLSTNDQNHTLKQVILSKNLTEIKSNAFHSCYALTAVNFPGTKAQWNAISIETDNRFLLNAKIICTDGEIN